MVTMKRGDYCQKFLKNDKPQTNFGPREIPQDVYLYKTIGPFCLRSQIDCWHPDLPGPNKYFDLKTRATHAIRVDCANHMKHSTYTLSNLVGSEASYELEYYDMIRSVFMKYSFQMKIGNMGGVFVAYHNTQQLLGFEYITSKEVDECVFSSQILADKSFEVSLKLFAAILGTVTDRFPDQAVKLIMWAHNEAGGILDIFAQPLSTDNGWTETPVIDEKSLSDPVYWYQLKLKTYLGASLARGPLDYRDGETLSVYFQLNEMQVSGEEKFATYLETVKRANIYQEMEQQGLENEK